MLLLDVVLVADLASVADLVGHSQMRLLNAACLVHFDG